VACKRAFVQGSQNMLCRGERRSLVSVARGTRLPVDRRLRDPGAAPGESRVYDRAPGPTGYVVGTSGHRPCLSRPMTEVRVVGTEAEYEDVLSVRYRVFVDEQGVDPDLEVDEHEETSTHVVAYDGGEPVGAARLRAKEPESEHEEKIDTGETAKIERVAVVAPRREEGIGREIMDVVETEAREQGFTEAALHSQTRAAGFYEALGYEQVGGEFEEAGIPHVAMWKSL